MKISDAVFGIILIVFSVFVLIYSRTLPTLPGYAYGSGFFPSFAAFFVLGGGSILLVRGIRAKQTAMVLGEWTKSRRLVLNLCLIPLNLVFYMAASETLGFVLTSFIMMFSTIWWLRRKVVSTFFVSSVSALLIYGFFAKLMFVPLSAGFLGI